MTTTTEVVTERNMPEAPTYDQVLHALARRFYIAMCEHRQWTPYSYPYVDRNSISSARIAIDFLGYDDNVDINE